MLKASRLKRGEVKLRANKDIMFTPRVSDLQLPLLTSGHSQSVAVGASVFCQLTAVFVAPFLNRFPSHACMIYHLFFFQFHIFSQWPIAFHVM